ncbi:MAG: MerR family transcriptional regulator [Planctomycetales bacterium]|nr:MerR family transcriptional regulator [Planctomycetales bacterium]
MFSIGEFSKITGLTVKTLRFYHERAVLIPARIESGSGYRYYDQCNVEQARVIVVLREFGFSLEQIVEILRDCRDETDLVGFLEQRRAALKQAICRDRELVRCIDRIIQQNLEIKQMIQKKTYEVEEKRVPELLVAGIRVTGRYDECGKVFGQLGRKLGRHISGTPLCLIYDDEYREDHADFEPSVPIRKPVQIDGVDIRSLPDQLCLTLVHLGPYTQLGRSYEILIRYAKERGYRLTLPSREVYVKGPGMFFRGNPKNYLTEIQIPFERQSDTI